ncbi:MAG TPA: GNAT family N-acetyltransferase [Caulobacteraceae bacterium]|jgi:CelD/BcsL family acetyltransferase involved in cellulose biosynthesis
MTSVEIITSRAGFEATAAEWNALADRASPSPLLRHEWLLTAARTLSPDDDLAVAVARRDGRLCAAAPLVVDRSTVVPRLRLLGWQTSEPEAFLYEDEDALEAVCRAVLRLGRPVMLQRLATDSPEWRLLGEHARRRGFAVLRPSTSPYYFTALEKDWPAFEQSIAGKKRSELRKLRRDLESHGEVAFEMLRPADPETALRLLDELQRIEASGWKGRDGTDMLSRPPLARFMAEYAGLAARRGMLRISVLRLKGEPVVVQMDIEHGGRLWGLKMGTDERWLKCGPGILSTHEICRWAIENGLEGLEHMGRAEQWQRRWPHVVRDCSSFRFYPRRLGAAVAFGLDTAEYARRKVADRAA